MKYIFIIMLKLLGVFAVLIGGLLGYGYYVEYPARSFCHELSDRALPAEVITLAQNKGLFFFDSIQEKNMLRVFNHKSPFFRVACTIEFKDNQIISKTIEGAD
jgi:hypothetical protein